jgi:hypothetical protein
MPVSRAFLYISFRIPSKEAPLQVLPTELPQRQMLHFQSHPSNISQSSQEMDPPQVLERIENFQSLILHIS